MRRHGSIVATVVGLTTMFCAPSLADATEGVRVLPSGGLRGETAALALRGEQGGTLEFDVLALPVPSDGGGGVPLVIEVEGSDLLEGAERSAKVELVILAIDEEGKLGASLLRVVEIDLSSEAGRRLGSSGLKLLGRLPLGGGRWTLRTLVRSLSPNGRLSLRVSPLPIETNSRVAMVSPPVAMGPASEWVVAALDDESRSLAGGESLPLARPLVGEPAELELTVAALRLDPRARLDIGIYDASGTELARRMLSRAQRRRTTAVGIELFEGTLDLSGLPPGLVQLQASSQLVFDNQFQRDVVTTASLGLPTVIAGRALPEGIATWAQALGGDGPAPPPSDTEYVARRGRASRLSIEREELERSLREVFATLSDARGLEARIALEDLESRALAGSGAAVPTLAEAELAVCRDLARRDPEALVPIALLWLDVYRVQRARQEYLLSTHARGMVGEVTDLYVQTAKEEGARRLASRIHAILGTELQSGGLSRLAAATFERAMELDPGNDLAPLAIATELERRAALGEAAGVLGRLLAAQPGHREGLLRLGVVEARLGRDSNARQRLGELLAQPTTGDWIDAVAAQELVRLELAGNRLEQAAAAARQGLAKVPGDDNLLVALAAVADLLGHKSEARERVDELADPRGRELGPRARYGAPPEAAIERVESELRDSAIPRHQRLALALAPDVAEVRS